MYVVEYFVIYIYIFFFFTTTITYIIKEKYLRRFVSQSRFHVGGTKLAVCTAQRILVYAVRIIKGICMEKKGRRKREYKKEREG